MHDQAMVDLQEIEMLENMYSQKLKLIDSLENEGISGNNFAQDRVKLLEINNKLKESNHQMKLWMHAYKGDSARNLKPEKALVYFESQKEKILKLKITTTQNLTEAKSFIKNNYEN